MPVHSAELAETAALRGVRSQLLVNGIETALWHYPAVTTKPKGTIVFVHGFRGSHDGLHTIIAALPEYDCYAGDIPGFGQTEAATTPHDLTTYSAWLGELIKAIGLNKPIVLGHSFGTLVVTSHAAKQLGDMGRLILINPVSRPGLEGPRRFISKMTEIFLGTAGKFPEKIARALIDSWVVIQYVSSTMAKTKDRSLRKWIHQQHHQTMSNYVNKEVLNESYQASIRNCVQEYAERIDNETLMIAGQFDDITSVEQQIDTSHMIRNCQLEVIPGVGHLIHYETPDKAAELIRDFLK